MRHLVSVILLALATPAVADPDLAPLIGARVDPGARFVDEGGRASNFNEFLAPDGTLLVLGYHRCENMCGLLQAALAEMLKDLDDPPRVLFTSLDPEERPEDARAMRASLHEAVPAADLSEWRFLTGTAKAVAAVAEPMGLETYVRPGGDVLVHPIALGVLTPAGALSEVFFALDFSAAELETALDRAADGYVGGLRERVILLCSGLDEAVGRVARAAWDGIRLAAILGIVLLAAGIYRLGRREGR